jgi:hypothetical protein
MGVNVAFDMRPAPPREAFVLEAFTIRAQARASLVAAGEMSLHEAVDGLQEAAIDTGLVDQLGQDAVQEIMSDAFGRALAFAHTMTAETAPEQRVSEKPFTPEQPPRRDLAASTIDALKYVIRQRDPEQLRKFLARRPRDELSAMKRLMVAK